MTENEQQLEQAKRDRQLTYDTANAEIARLEKVIEAEKKPEEPEERVGDYGISGAAIHPRIILPGGKVANKMQVFTQNCANRITHLYGNTFDDIAELEKGPLEKFAMNDKDFFLEEDGSLKIQPKLAGYTWRISPENLQEFSILIRRMKLTQEGVLK